MNPKLTTVAISTLALVFAACSTPKGRIKAEGEEDLVGSRRAGVAVYSRLVEEGVQKILARSGGGRPGAATPQLKVAFLPVENKSGEPLGDFHEQLYQLIDTSINSSNTYRTISTRYVEAGLKAARLRPDELFLPAQQRNFVGVMETSGNPIECLLFATLTTGTTRGEDLKQVDYALTMELVDIQTGDNFKETVRIPKEYTR